VLDLVAYVSIVLYYNVHSCCVIVTWSGEPGEIESYLTILLHCFDPVELVFSPLEVSSLE